MQYSIENDILRLTVDTHGAEPVSVIHKPTSAVTKCRYSVSVPMNFLLLRKKAEKKYYCRLRG